MLEAMKTSTGKHKANTNGFELQVCFSTSLDFVVLVFFLIFFSYNKSKKLNQTNIKAKEKASGEFQWFWLHLHEENLSVCLQAPPLMWNLPTSPEWPSHFQVARRTFPERIAGAACFKTHACQLNELHANANWSGRCLAAKVIIGWNCTVKWLWLWPVLGEQPGQLRSLPTWPSAGPLHFNRNPRIFCEWSPLGGFLPPLWQPPLATSSISHRNVHFRASTGNGRWMKAVRSAWRPLWHTSQRK